MVIRMAMKKEEFINKFVDAQYRQEAMNELDDILLNRIAEYEFAEIDDLETEELSSKFKRRKITKKDKEFFKDCFSDLSNKVK